MKNSLTSKWAVGRPNVGNTQLFRQLVEKIIERRWFTNYGEVVQELERKLEAYLGVKHCIAVCNATLGLQVVCHALELKGEAVSPAFTFVATPHSLKWEGVQPVFADVDTVTHLLDPDSVRRSITSKTTAILGVHLWGRACHPTTLSAIAEEYGLELYFDAAHAFGCTHHGVKIGSFGRCEVFSFHATKFFNTFEGGAIATNDEALAERIRLMINFGFKGQDKVISLGANGKMSEIHAAMGLACLDQIDRLMQRNQIVYQRYKEHLSNIPGVRFMDYDDVELSNAQYIVIEVNEAETGVSRDQVLMRLHEENIIARRYFYPGCHLMEPYVSELRENPPNLPGTVEISSKILILPGGSSLEEEDVDFICDLFKSALKKS